MIKFGMPNDFIKKLLQDKSENTRTRPPLSHLNLQPHSFEDYQIFYNLYIIKISIAMILLKSGNVDEETFSQFSNIEKSILDIVDQLEELRYGNHEFVN